MKFILMMIAVAIVAVVVFFGLNIYVPIKQPGSTPTSTVAENNIRGLHLTPTASVAPPANSTPSPAATQPGTAMGGLPATVSTAPTPTSVATASTAVTIADSAGVPEVAAPPVHLSQATHAAPSPPVHKKHRRAASKRRQTRPSPPKPVPTKPVPVDTGTPARKTAAASEAAASPEQWWLPDSTAGRNHLALTFAGDASFTHAIVLLFSQAMTTPENGSIHVTKTHGNPVSGHWTVSTENSRMLIFKVPPGNYVVSVSGALQDKQGHRLGERHSGPVTVH